MSRTIYATKVTARISLGLRVSYRSPHRSWHPPTCFLKLLVASQLHGSVLNGMAGRTVE